MLQYSTEQLTTVIAIPIVTILLTWTVAIFHKNRKKWGPYDIPIVSVLVLSITRNITVLTYTLIITLHQTTFNLEYCSIVIWIFNSIHTFQASLLSTIAVIGLFSAKLYRKQQSLKQFLTSTHVIYHLFCLTTLCACVGVAAILAQDGHGGNFEKILVFDVNPCKFMPFDLDIKFNVFIIVLHAFLAVVSLSSFLLICYNYFQIKRNGFDYLKKSNSDLSDLSLGLTNNYGNENKNYYDTYTIHRGNNGLENNYFDGQNNGGSHPVQNFPHGAYCNGRDVVWNSDMSNISTTVSSTNSRRPCIAKQLKEEEDENRTGLETIHPVLIVCYLFYHLPLIVLCIYPKLVYPWPVAGIALWLGLIQDLLVPIGLGLVDSRFCKWVSTVYRCSGNHVEEKLPHVGLDGKFRPFGSSQPQSLEVNNIQQDRNQRGLQAVEHRFPITNGSLYTSIDGRLPVIHNYRRHKDLRGPKPPDQSSNVALHSSHLNRKESTDTSYQNALEKFSCRSCEVDLCPSHSNLHHLSPNYINKQLNFVQNQNTLLLGRHPLQSRMSLSQESLRYIPETQLIYKPEINNPNILKNSRNLVRLNRMRLSKSEDSLNEAQKELQNLQNNSDIFKNSNKKALNEQILDYSSSDDDYMTDINHDNNKNFDSLSSQSCCSITTEANCDFEFYQNKEKGSKVNQTNDFFLHNNSINNNRPIMSSFKPNELLNHNSFSRNDSLILDVNKNFRITRSNSKRSLENFQAFIEEEIHSPLSKLQRANSYTTLEDRKNRKQNKKLLRSNSKLSDCTHNIRHKIKSVEYLPNSNASTVYIEDVCYLNKYSHGKNSKESRYVGSVPDFKKVFISEYI